VRLPVERRFSRKEAFFGLHFDIHVAETDTNLWSDISEELAERLLVRVKPDYIQWDCKGYPGYASYPTRFGCRAPGIRRDALALWRKVTCKHGVGLYIHYSGLWDEAAVKRCPEWARMDAKGRRDSRIASVFGPYVEQLLIPQLLEVITMYDVDGVWIDGDC